MPNYIRVAGTADIAAGAGIVASVDGTFYVIDNTCKHRGGPLGEGELEGDTVTCPWHGWQYNVKTGVCLTKDGIKMDCFAVKVEGGDIKAALP